MTWIPNSSVNLQCCLGKIIDVLGTYSISVLVGPVKKKVSFQVRPDKRDDFESNKYFMRGALMKKSISPNGNIWYSFDWNRMILLLREVGLC